MARYTPTLAILEGARHLARQNIAAFNAGNEVASPSSPTPPAVVRWGFVRSLLVTMKSLPIRAQNFSARVRDISQNWKLSRLIKLYQLPMKQ